MAYLKQSFVANDAFSSTNINQMEANIVSTRTVAGEVREFTGSLYLTSSGLNTIYYDSRVYIDQFGYPYYYDTGLPGDAVSGNEYAFIGVFDQNTTYNFDHVSITAKFTVARSSVSSQLAHAIIYSNTSYSASSEIISISSSSFIDDELYITVSANMIYINPISIAPLQVLLVAPNSTNVLGGNMKTWVGVQYLTRNF